MLALVYVSNGLRQSGVLSQELFNFFLADEQAKQLVLLIKSFI